MTRAVRVAELSSLFGSAGDRPEIVLLLKAYFDLSASPRMSLIAGYAGTADQWDALEEAWKNNLEYWELTDFHLCDLPRMMGHGRADLCILTFAHLIRESGLNGVSAGVENALYHEKKWSADFSTPYHVCADMILDTLNTHVPLNMNDSSVAVVFDRDTDKQDAVHAMLDKYKNSGVIAGVAFSDRKTTPALQIANLAAGTVRKGWVEDHFFDLLPQTAKALTNAIGVTHFGVALSYETEALVTAQRAKRALAEDKRG